MGAFSPVTESGRIVSDGIMFSVYEELTSHVVAHLAFSNFNKQLKKIPFLKNFFYKEFGGQSLILTITQYLQKIIEYMNGTGLDQSRESENIQDL